MQPAPPAWSKNTVMPIDAILNSQWTAYNRRKQTAGADPGLFDYTAAWEVNYLGRRRQEEVAMEVNGKGIFTNLLLEALKGGAADINGNITPGSVYAYIDQALGPWEQRPVFKTNVTTFTTLRHMQPRIAADSLKKINQYFPAPTALHPLDPSFEDTNIPDREHVCITPYADAAHVAVFRDLQRMHSVGLVVPVDADHMYWAAMQGKACKLTPLGEHYWRLAQENKI